MSADLATSSGLTTPGGHPPREGSEARRRWDAEVARARGDPGAGGHANRPPDDLTWQEWQRAVALARTLYPMRQLSADGTARSERYIRRALAIALVLDNPQLAPLTPEQVAAAPRRALPQCQLGAAGGHTIK